MGTSIDLCAARARLTRAARAALTGLCAIAGLGAVFPAALAAPPPLARGVGCLVEPAQVALVGSAVVGVLDNIAVERGDIVATGQVLAELNSNVEQAALRVAEARARLDADVRAAEANQTLARQRLDRAKELDGTQYISSQMMDQLRAEHDVATQRLVQSRTQQQIWGRELRLARAQLELRRVRSPFDGVVVERFAEPGERVEEKPIMKIAQVDPLRVELMVPASSYGRYQPGDAVTVRPELPGAEPVVANVRRVDSIVDAASNTFRVQLHLPNPGNRLPAGLRCRVDEPLRLQGSTGGRAAAAPGAVTQKR